MDYEEYYSKIFSCLNKEEARLLLRLIKDERTSMKNSLDLGVEKDEFLKEFTSGPSLDKIEELSDSFSLVSVDGAERVEHFIVFVSNLSLECPAVRAITIIEGLEKKWDVPRYYSAFSFHSLDKRDYVLLGFEKKGEDGLDS